MWSFCQLIVLLVGIRENLRPTNQVRTLRRNELTQATCQLFSKNARGNTLVEKKRKVCNDGSRPHWITGVCLHDIPEDPRKDISSNISFDEVVKEYLACGLPKPPIEVHVAHDQRAAGRCAFASRSLINGEIICEYKGELVTSNVAADREKSNLYSNKPAAMFKIRDTEPKWLDPHALPAEEAGPAYLINHSNQNANLAPRLHKQRGKTPRLFLVAKTCIAQGQELLYNYRFPPNSQFPFLTNCQTYAPLGDFVLDSDNSEDER